MAAIDDMPRPYKIPRSVLVIIHTRAGEVLMLRRADTSEDFWQCVTGSQDTEDEALETTALREVFEETGIDASATNPHGARLQDWKLQNVYPIYPRWLHRYAPGITHNTEHVFGLYLPERVAVQLQPREHTDFCWLPWREAAGLCFSPSNAEAILMLPRFVQ